MSDAILMNRPEQCSFTAGCGSVQLEKPEQAPSFYSHFGMGGDNMFFYTIRHKASGAWECGTGHLHDPVTLVRDTVLHSSNNGAPVSFPPGPKTVTNESPFFAKGYA